MVVDNAAQSPVDAVAVAVEEAPGIPWDGLNAGEHPEFFTNYPAGTVPKGASPAAVPITPPGADVHIVSGEAGSMEPSEPDVPMDETKEEESEDGPQEKVDQHYNNFVQGLIKLIF